MEARLSADLLGDGVTIGAGQGFQGLYEFAEANDITIVGGSALTVGPAGGWISGGGHSSMSNLFGLGVDNALQIKAVLPNGALPKLYKSSSDIEQGHI